MKFDLSNLKKAIASLEESINIADKFIHNTVNTPEQRTIRAGVIQNFEFTYELCWKFIKRFLDNKLGSEIPLTKKDLFRTAFENGFINDSAKVTDWFGYNEARNSTSHTYDEDKADIIYGLSKFFLKDAKDLLNNLETENEKN